MNTKAVKRRRMLERRIACHGNKYHCLRKGHYGRMFKKKIQERRIQELYNENFFKEKPKKQGLLSRLFRRRA